MPTNRKGPPKRIKFTDAWVRKVEPLDRMVTYWDTIQRGLGLLVTPTGCKSWRVVYRVKGKTVWLTIDKVEAIGLADARKAARIARARAALGEDVAAEKREARKKARESRQARGSTFTAPDQLLRRCWLQAR